MASPMSMSVRPPTRSRPRSARSRRSPSARVRWVILSWLPTPGRSLLDQSVAPKQERMRRHQTACFLRDCATRGVDTASTTRSHGIGLLYDGAESGENLIIDLATSRASYKLEFGMSSGRIESFPGEALKLLDNSLPSWSDLLRAIGSSSITAAWG